MTTTPSSAGDGAADVVAIATTDDDGPSPSSSPKHEEPPPTIRPIPSESIGRIVAGQAITDLCSAVKELLDNSIDAGAGRICVKLHDEGLETIEVTDNGHGVPKSSRPYMATKHATSKLRKFDDLYDDRDPDARARANDDGRGGDNGDDDDDGDRRHDDCAPTLGFRGEALFCLANLSRSLVVSTRTANENDEIGPSSSPSSSSSSSSSATTTLGEQFRFDSDGRILSESIRRVPLSYSSGTTVSVHGLFESLPVRRVDMKRRIKAQKMKLVKMMQGYAIMCLGTQFNLIDVQSGSSNGDDAIGGGGVVKSKKGRGAKDLIETSVSSKTLESRTSSILGTKFLSGLTRIDIDLSPAVRSSSSTSSSSSSSSSTTNDGTNRWRLSGLISHAPSSPHATARELQFFSINGRPVDLPSVSRVMGDVWRTFDPTMASSSNAGGGRRRPACVLSFALPRSMYDVNISPDKREVMFTEEAAIANLIKDGLMALWSDQTDGTFEANEVESRSNRNVPRGAACHGDAIMEAVENSGVSESIEYSIEETLPTANLNHKNGAFVNANDVDDEVDYVTPKLRRRNVDDGGPLVTPSESGCSSEMIENQDVAISPMLRDSIDASCDSDSGGVNGGAPPMSVETPVENSCQSTDASATPDRNDIYARHEQTCGDKKESEQDRRRWEQTRLNFQRIDNAQLRQGLDRMLSPSKEEEEEEEDFGGHNNVRCRPQSSVALSTSRRPASIKRHSDNDDISPGDRFISHRPPKRSKQKKSRDVSFLDSFAYGSTKPAQNAIDSDYDELENNQGHVVPEPLQNRKASHGKQFVGTTRMVEGRRAVEKRSQSSYLETSFDESKKPFPSTTRSRQSTPLEDQVADNVDGGTPAEMVWNSFSGTQNVIKQSRNARLEMQKTRKYLQTITKLNRGSYRDSAVELPANGKTAIKEDSTVNLCKEDIRHMSIIGQFNLGFILARCRNQNLWILDQHACDEKYNFERLCKETVIHEQKLIAPLPLELSPSEEHCVLEHEDVFERNGFRFSYDPEKEPRHRLSLTALPYSGSGGDGKKAVQFGKEDVGALCAILGADGTLDGYLAGFDTAGVNAVRRFAGSSSHGIARSDDIVGSSIVRLPKAIAMFASRACRGSIMIGTALSEKEQVEILNKLDKTDVPWNCAHGRPTMSHIRSLTECLITDDDEMVSHVAGPNLSIVGDI